jgi:hypothetical protein
MMPAYARKLLIDDLARIEGHIVSSEMNVTNQRARVEGQRQSGSRSALSQSVLATIETTLQLHRDNRDRILRDLAE